MLRRLDRLEAETMLTLIRSPRCVGFFFVALVLASAGVASGQTTAFSYQGQLSDAGGLANGSYDLRFALFDTVAGGAQIGGAQTVSAVPVSDGVFTVQLDFGVNAFPGADRFVEIAVKPVGAGSFTTLAPRQQISSTPYSIRTLSAATADALSSACVGCVQNTQINSVAGSKVTGTISAASVPSGSGSYIQNTTAPQPSANFNISGNGVVGGNLTVAGTLNANVGGNFIQNRTTPQANTNFNISGDGTLGGTLSAANVAVGTTAPNHRLRIGGGPSWTSAFWSGALELDNASAMGWHANAGDARFGIGQSDGGLFFFHTGSDPGTTGSAAKYDLLIADSGNIGIGTITPQSKLSIETDDEGCCYGFTHTFEGVTLGTYVDGFQGAIGTRSNHPLSLFANNGTAEVTITTNGNVGIGWPIPATKLDVRGDLTLDAGRNPFIYTAASGAEVNRYLSLYNSPTFQSASGLKAGGILVSDNYGYANPGKSDLIIKGNLGVGTPSPAARLDVAGRARVKSVEITGGGDVAEPFRIAPRFGCAIEPGMVVVIDPDHPGELVLSSRAYDRRVAGVISVANSLAPGMLMAARGNAYADGDHPIALTGRVWTKCDATESAIEPGDLLTTSGTPGYAMKVADPARAQGAVLGKAMTPLARGATGVVLTLVSLQ
jgi:hypothetical protein